MKLMKCICDPGGSVNVQGPDYGRTLQRDAIVDFDEPLSKDNPKTWGDALERHKHLFVPVDEQPASTLSQPRRRQAAAPDVSDHQ